VLWAADNPEHGLGPEVDNVKHPLPFTTPDLRSSVSFTRSICVCWVFAFIVRRALEVVTRLVMVSEEDTEVSEQYVKAILCASSTLRLQTGRLSLLFLSYSESVGDVRSMAVSNVLPRKKKIALRLSE